MKPIPCPKCQSTNLRFWIDCEIAWRQEEQGIFAPVQKAGQRISSDNFNWDTLKAECQDCSVEVPHASLALIEQYGFFHEF